MIGYKNTTTRLSVVFFFETPAPTPLQTTFFTPLSVWFFFLGLTFLALVGYCSAVPLQLGAESERAPCPAPVPPIYHCPIPNICLFFPSPMQAPPPPPPETLSRSRFGRSGRLFFLVWSPSHLHECLRLSVLLTPLLCPMFANVSLFFLCYPTPNGPSSRVSWSIQSDFLGDRRTPI